MPRPDPDLLLRIGRVAAITLALSLLWWLGSHLGLLRDRRWLPELFCVLVALACWLGWSPRGVSPRQGRLVAIGLALVAIPALVIQANGRVENWGRDLQVAEWGVFHYYLGSKYFDELQYTSLYREAYIADWGGGEGPKAFEEVRKIRNLETYGSLKTRGLRKAERSERWSDERWAEFAADVEWLGRQAEGARWGEILHDRGYNPPPSYTLIAGFWTGLLSLRHPLSQTLLINLDMLLLLGGLLFSIRAYGVRRSLLVLVAFLLWYGNSNRVYGQIWILDWFVACWAACSAWKLRRTGLSGGLIAYAACMRVFPAVLLLGPLVAWVAGRLRGQRGDGRHLVRFFAAAAITGVLLFAGSTLRYGPGAWRSFGENIAEHNTDHTGGQRRFGLEHLFLLDFQDGLQARPHKVKVKRNLEANQGRYQLVAGLLVLLTLLAMARSEEHDAMLLGVALFFALMVASRYYGALTVLLLLLGLGSAPARAGPASKTAEVLPDSVRSAGLLVFDCTMLLLIWCVYAGRFPRPRVQYLFSNLGWLCWWIALLGVVAFAARRRLDVEADPV